MRRKFKLRFFVLFGAVILSGSALLYTSQEVQQAERRLYVLAQEIEKERESIAVLQAEWAYLNTPERLEQLASGHLGMRVMEPYDLRPIDFNVRESVLFEGRAGGAAHVHEGIIRPAQKPSALMRLGDSDIQQVIKELEAGEMP